MWIAAFVLFAISIGGALTYDQFGVALRGHLNLILAFGGAFLIGIIFNHLIPETYAMGSHVGWIIVIGFLLQGLLEYLSQGVEHGHLHVHQNDHHRHNLPWSMVISLCLHALLESMPLNGHDHDHNHDHAHLTGLEGVDMVLLLGLILHKFPVALVLMGMLQAMGVSRKTSWFTLIVFGLMPLTGMLIYEVLIHSGAQWADQIPLYTNGILIGILLHISTTILFETGDGHRFNRNKLLITVAGLLLALLTTTAF